MTQYRVYVRAKRKDDKAKVANLGKYYGIRTFNGRKYASLPFTFPQRSAAEHWAKGERERGRNARIIRSKTRQRRQR